MGDLDRIHWRCRRGLLELDLVLEAFLKRGYGRLDAGQRRLFNELLEQPDNDLLDLALGRSEPNRATGRWWNCCALMRGRPRQ
jgi:succinate dehydrogenase flavin-adding protein (antitoxin of CptAB toxin-antitoxin module)